jgi:uncharacterized protein (TIGR03435 family)
MMNPSSAIHQAVGSAAAMVLLSVVLATAPIAAQSLASGAPDETFEVASIRPTTRRQVPAPRVLPNGQFEMTGTTLRDLLRVAYSTNRGQVDVIGPDWVGTARFDVVAKPPAGTKPTVSMLQNLLRNRFSLKAHLDTRQGVVWNLTLADEKGRLGEGLAPSRCGAAADDSPVQTADEALQRLTTGRGMCGALRIGAGPTLFGEGSLDDLASILSNFPVINAPVADRTGLSGAYDMRVRWRADNNLDPDAGPLIFTALEEQLGLKLQRGTGTVEVLVIDEVHTLAAD